MKTLKDFILIHESHFSNKYFFHNNYGKMVLQDILDGNDIILGDKGDGYRGYDSINKSDFTEQGLSIIQDLYDNYHKYSSEDPIEIKNKFNDAFDKVPDLWGHIWKIPYSSSKRKVNGGMKFEEELCILLQEFILTGNITTQSQYENIAKRFYEKIKDHKTIRKIKDILENDENKDISKYVFVSGKGSTARNKYGQILNNDTLEVNINKKREITEKSIDEVENILTQSGKIIADITITSDENFDKSDINHVNKDDIYISCKDGDSQLSGISMQQPFYGNSTKSEKNSWIIQCYNGNKPYEEFAKNSDDICVKSFNNLCNLLGVDNRTVYEYFSKPINEREKNITIGINKKPKEKDEIISILIQLLVGGNYWYVNSGKYTGKKDKSDGEVVYVDDNIDENKFEFIPSGNGHLEPSLIAVSGTLKTKFGDIGAELKFRTSAGLDSPYPFRLFIVINDKHIISHLYA